MQAPENGGWRFNPAAMTQTLASFALIAAIITFVGWFGHWPRLTDWNEDGIAMFPNTAALIGLAALALQFFVRGWRKAVVTLAAIIAAVSTATLCEHLTGLDFHIDALILVSTWGFRATNQAGRMGIPGCVSLLAIAIGLLSLGSRRPRRTLTTVCGALVGGLALLSLTGYFFGADALYSIPSRTGIAMQTSIVLLALAMGLLTAVPDCEPMRTLAENSAAGAMARRALPFIIVIPIVIGALCLRGLRARYYDDAFEDAVFVIMLIGSLTFALFWLAAAVRRYEATLRASEQFNRSIVDSSDDAIICKGLDGIISSWNPAAEHMFGYTAAEAIGKHISIIFPADRLKEEDDILTKLQQGQRFEHYETVRVRKDGTQLNVSLSVSALRDERGNLIGASKISRDITASKKAAAALQEEARNLELLNETGRMIASELDLNQLVQKVTDAGTELTGAKFGAFFYNVVNEQGEAYLLFTLSGAPRESFEKFGLPRNTPVFSPTFRGEGVVRSADITKDPRYGTMEPHHGMPQGHLPVRSYLAAPVTSRSGAVIGGLFFGHPDVNVFGDRAERLVVGIAAQAAIAIDNARLYDASKREIEQRKVIEQNLQAAKDDAERASRAKDEFLAIVSHELRTPLTAIVGWTRMLLNGDVDEPTTAHAMRVIERNARHQTKLIEDLLDVSRVITGKLALTIGAVDLGKTLTAAVESVKPAADAKQVTLESNLDRAIEPIAGDAGRLQQVFWNLLSNAVKFTPKGGRVRINLTRDDGNARIEVEDNGIGIDPAALPHLFEKFYQSDSSKSRVHGGLGLGLSIVRHLVEQHGGRATVQSAGFAQGATFTVELPIRVLPQSERSTGNGTLQPTSKRPLEGVRTLVVEDDKDSRDLLLSVLRNAGAESTGTATADEALAQLESNPPDLVISDIGLPTKDGYAFIRELRAKPASRKIPVVALTAYARDEDKTQALSAGFDLHVPKPIDPVDLITRVASLVEQ